MTDEKTPAAAMPSAADAKKYLREEAHLLISSFKTEITTAKNAATLTHSDIEEALHAAIADVFKADPAGGPSVTDNKGQVRTLETHKPAEQTSVKGSLAATTKEPLGGPEVRNTPSEIPAKDVVQHSAAGAHPGSKSRSSFFSDKKAVTSLEYGIIASVLGVTLVAIFKPLGATLATVFAHVGASI